MDEAEIAQLEQELARTSALVLRAATLAERMTRKPPSPTLPGNLRRLQDAVQVGREHLLQVSEAEEHYRR